MNSPLNLNPGLDDEGLTQDFASSNDRSSTAKTSSSSSSSSSSSDDSCEASNGFTVSTATLNSKISTLTPFESALYIMQHFDPEMAQPIEPNDIFANIQSKILWKDKWKYVSSYQTLPAPIFVLPGGRHPREGREGEDFVCGEYGLRKFCVENLGWKGDAKYEEGKREEEEEKEGRGRKRRKSNLATPSPVVVKKVEKTTKEKKAQKKKPAQNSTSKETTQTQPPEEEEPLVQSDDSDSDSSSTSSVPSKTGKNHLLGSKILWPTTSSIPLPFKNSTNGTKITLLTQINPGDFQTDVGLMIWNLTIPAHRSTKLDKNLNGIWAHTITKGGGGRLSMLRLKWGRRRRCVRRLGVSRDELGMRIIRGSNLANRC
ncbi:hypothetical protein TL16_g07388 [Triparma laevis f. inornata]|uniref:Uncharacterized protein n=1 Tax=Triparma laevis f. inornata TaxID=1714386 RepID=A0A9W7EHV9_9STRA|nr:hypothetical protein TL16_g07388 [Triparma laevis f. inornata]